jgi:rusticyanin
MRGQTGLLSAVLIAVGLAGVLVTGVVGCSGPTGMTGGDPGRMMGSMMARSGSETVPASQANHLGNAVPIGAEVTRSANLIRFHDSARLVVVASPDTGPDMTFRIAGLADPRIVVPVGTTVTIRFINADHDTSHGLIVTDALPPFPYMEMMGAPQTFSGGFAMPLGDATSSGMPAESVTFTAGAKGRFTYLCPVPGHAQQGMFGELDVV